MGQQVRYGRRRSHGAGALIAAVILVVAALIAAWTLLPRLFTPRETARTAEEAYCAAVSSDGARRTLTPDQAQNAALIANIAVTRGLPDHAATVAIATAMQESRLIIWTTATWIRSACSNSGPAKAGARRSRCPT